MLNNSDYEGARKETLELRSIFGEKNFFLEIQNHHLDEDARVIEGLRRLSSDISTPLVATNDAHYMKRSDAAAKDILIYSIFSRMNIPILFYICICKYPDFIPFVVTAEDLFQPGE